MRPTTNPWIAILAACLGCDPGTATTPDAGPWFDPDVVAELEALGERCGEGDLLETDVDGMPAFQDDTNFLARRVLVESLLSPSNPLPAGSRLPERITAAFRNGVVVSFESLQGWRFPGPEWQSPPVATVRWRDADDRLQTVCGGPATLLAKQSESNSPYRIAIDVVASGATCATPAAGRVRVCF